MLVASLALSGQARAIAPPTATAPPQLRHHIEGETVTFETIDRAASLRVTFRQPHHHQVLDVHIDQEGWAFVDGWDVDYAARLAVQHAKLAATPVVEYPRLYTRGCSVVWAFFGGCQPAPARFSAALQRAFISGHPASLFGFAPRAGVELRQGAARALDPSLQSAVYLYDAGEPGVAVWARGQDALLYDGSSSTTLRIAEAKSWRGNRPPWSVQTAGGRIFLGSNALWSGTPFLYEFADGTLIRREAPEGLAGWTVVGSNLSGRIYAIAAQGVFEIRGAATVLRWVPPPASRIRGPAGVTTEPSVSFDVELPGKVVKRLTLPANAH